VLRDGEGINVFMSTAAIELFDFFIVEVDCTKDIIEYDSTFQALLFQLVPLGSVNLVNGLWIVFILWNDVLCIYYIPIFWSGGNDEYVVNDFVTEEFISDPLKEMSLPTVGSGKYRGIANFLIKSTISIYI